MRLRHRREPATFVRYGDAIHGYGVCKNGDHQPYPHGLRDGCVRWRLVPTYCASTSHLLESAGSGYRLGCGHLVASGMPCAWDQSLPGSTCWGCASR